MDLVVSYLLLLSSWFSLPSYLSVLRLNTDKHEINDNTKLVCLASESLKVFALRVSAADDLDSE